MKMRYTNYQFDVLVISRLINSLEPGAVKKINTMKAPFKQVKADFISPFVSFEISRIWWRLVEMDAVPLLIE